MLIAHHDFETGSAVDLRKAGVHKYAEHWSTRVWCMSWWFEGTQQMQRWWPGAPDPEALLHHIAQGGIVGVHNAVFERTIWNKIIRVRYCPHWPELRIEQQDCTMARAASVGLPQSLDVISKVVGAKAQKDMEGNAIMLKLSKPRKVEADGTLTWWDTPEIVSRTMAYCDQDVVTETEIGGLLPDLSEAEKQVWALDQAINDRGIQLDVETIEHAIKVRDIARLGLDARMNELTDGAVTKCTEVSKLVTWLQAQGVECESVAKAEQQEILINAKRTLSPEIEKLVREAIELRQDASKTSTAKYQAMLNVVCADGRARGLLAYHGAFSGRWAGRLIQPQNLYRIDPERDGDDIQRAVEMLLWFAAQDAHDMLHMLFGSAMAMLAKTLRTMIVAARGKQLHGVDLANIEGRNAAWIAGEEWKLQAFRAYDEGRGPDLYRIAYARAFGIEPEQVTSFQRQIGKVMELALGYQGSVGSFVSMGKNYGLKPEALVPVVETASPEAFDFWCQAYWSARDKRGLPQAEWAAIKTVVAGWRKQHPGIVRGWWELQDAAIEAVLAPGQFIAALDGRVAYLRHRSFLYVRLPSGRVLAYCNPHVVMQKETWLEHPVTGKTVATEGKTDAQIVAHVKLGGFELKSREKKAVRYEGFDSETRKWSTFALYGGMQFNHIVQGTARDIMVGGMMRAEARGYPIVLTVHDEVLAETNLGFGSASELEAIMTAGETWLPGCPLAAKGWSGTRYSK
jgi:DNA polymerase bacteriophage-type